MTNTLVCELTTSGACGVANHQPGDRLLLPAATARWLETRGWAVILDDLDETETDQ